MEKSSEPCRLVSAGSLSNGIFRNMNSTWNKCFKKMPWLCYWGNFLRSFACAFDRVNATARRIPVKILRFFGPFFTQMGPSWFYPRSNMHIALLLSKMGSLMKISKSCSKVIQKTLRSSKNWLRYSFFSVMSRVKWPNLRAWPILEFWKTLQSTLAKHDIVSIFFLFWKSHCQYGLQCIALDKVD